MESSRDHARQKSIGGIGAYVPVDPHRLEYADGAAYLYSMERADPAGEEVIGHHDSASVFCQGDA